MDEELCKKCNRPFECHHEFEIFHAYGRPPATSNHCLKCGAGKDGDKCQGECPDCKEDDLLK